MCFGCNDPNHKETEDRGPVQMVRQKTVKRISCAECPFNGITGALLLGAPQCPSADTQHGSCFVEFESVERYIPSHGGF